MLKSKRVISMLFVLVMCFSMVFPMSVFADEVFIDVMMDSGIGDKTIESAMAKVNEMYSAGHKGQDYSTEMYFKSRGRDVLVGKVEGDNFILFESFNALKDAEKTKIFKVLMDEVLLKNEDDDAASTFFNDIQEMGGTEMAAVILPAMYEDIEGDLFFAYKGLSPFMSILNIVLGIGAVILIVILLGTTVIDLAFIGLPVLREATMNKTNGNKPGWITYDAEQTVREVEKGLDGEYKNAYLIYLKRRALTYIILAVCIMYLIGGGLSGIISFVLNLVSGFTSGI